MGQNARWAVADRISDAIVDLINAELKAMRDEDRVDGLQLLAGQLLAFCALHRTMPAVMPKTLKVARDAIQACLADMVSERRRMLMDQLPQ